MKIFTCARAVLVFASILSVAAQADDWNQWLGPDRNGQWHESGITKSFSESGPKVLWRKEIAGGYAGPAVSDGRVYVTDYVISSGDPTPNPGKKSELDGKERVHCFDIKTGDTIWTHEYECPYNLSFASGPRATPTVDKDRVYTLGAEGNLFCFNAKNGHVIWSKDLKKDYQMELAPHWGFTGHPLVDGDTLYCLVGGEGSVAVAFDKMTGVEKWHALTAKHPGYCPPTMIQAGGTKQLLIWHSESLNSLNPETGQLYWSFKMKPAYEMSVIAPIKHGDYLLSTALQGTSLLLKLDREKPAATEVWRNKGIHPDHNPPLIVDGHIYGVDVNGHLRCIELETGKRIWESTATMTGGRPANSTTGFIVKNDDHYYITTEQGELIIAKMSPDGFQELGRTKMLEPTTATFGRQVVWSHPAFALKCVFARNDKQLVCISLAE